MWILQTIFGVWVQILLIFHATDGESVLGYCSYDSMIFTLDCSMRQLSNFPDIQDTLNSSAVRIIKLNDNRLTTVPDLKVFEDLEYLDLSYNKITQLPAKAFQGLRKLKSLDLSMNEGFMLSDATVHHEAFNDLSKLKILKLKQEVRPQEGYAYAPLAILNQTLEELFMTGTHTFSSTFTRFTKLHTLSLGGEACEMEALGFPQLASLPALPLRRLSARNCNIQRVDVTFLQSYRRTLQKLDLSCNPLRPALANITTGVINSKLNTLLLDNINRVPDSTTGECNWYNITNRQLEPLQTVPLHVLSVQANQLGAYSNLMLRRYCVDLIYLDVSLNNFNKTAFYIAHVFEGQVIDDSSLSLFHNANVNLPAVRYLGLRSLSSKLSCGQQPLNCNADSELFLNDDYDWNVNQNPFIMDFTLLFEMALWVLPNCQSHIDTLTQLCFIDELQSLSKFRRELGQYTATDDAINQTVRYILNGNGQDFRNFLAYRYFPVNLTTLSMGNNHFSDIDTPRNSPLCSNIVMYPNNLVTFDFSGSELGFVPCRNISGFTHVTNFTCNYCKISGWDSDLLSSFPLKHLHLKGVGGLAPYIQKDMDVQLLSKAPGLETLDLSEMGLEWVTDNQFLSHHPNLTSLHLQNNRLKSWNITITGNPNLTLLDLRNNSISFMDETVRGEITVQHSNSQLQVFLSGNDVDCSNCTSAYITWLISSSAVVDVAKIKCRGTQRLIKHCAAMTTVTNRPSKTEAIDDQEIAAIVVGCVVILAVVILIAIVFNNRYIIIHQVLKRTKPKRSQQEDFTILAYASHSEALTENIAELITGMSLYGVKLKSRQTDVMYGALLKTSIVKLMVQCQKVVVFISPDYIKEDLCQFEMDIIQQRDPKDVIIVGVNIDAAAGQLDALPQIVTDIVLNNKHLIMPLGICSGNQANSKAFMLTLVDKVQPSQLRGGVSQAIGEAELEL